jgi:transposase
MRTNINPLTQALVGRFGEHHAFLCRIHLDRLDALTADIAKSPPGSSKPTPPSLTPSPGCTPSLVSDGDVATVIIAETGADMSRFPTPGHLARGPGWPQTQPVR